MKRWRNGQKKKELSTKQDNLVKKPEELESEFDTFDVDNSQPTSPFKGRNIVDLDFVCKQLLDVCKACKTTLSLTQCQRERLIGLASILYLNCQKCSTVTMIKTSTWHLSENTQKSMLVLSVELIRIRSS